VGADCFDMKANLNLFSGRLTLRLNYFKNTREHDASNSPVQGNINTLYAANVGLASLADSRVDRVAFDAGLSVRVSAGQRRAQLLTGRLRALIFFASIPIAFVSPTLGQLFWLALLLLPLVGRRAERDQGDSP